MKMLEFINSIENQLISYRQHLHKNPELSKHEYNTQKYIISILAENNIEYDIGAKTGVIAYINRNRQGKCVAFRADTDALPITELNTIDYKSQNQGVMHACGHDVHTTILLGVALTLNSFKEELEGSIKLFFQPNEEVSSGAKDLVNEGFMDNPKVDYILGLHVMPYLEVGEIEVRDGALNASSSSFRIEIIGKSAHAAYPHLGVNAIVCASEVVSQIQKSIVNKMSPTTEAVLSFGIIEGGTQTNIIPEKVIIRGTLRTLSIESRENIKKNIELITTKITDEYGGSNNCIFHDGYPPLINNVDLNKHIIKNANESTLITKINYKTNPSMGVEDFGYYQEKAIGSFYHLGCGNKELGIISGLHTNTFNVDEKCIKVGIELQVRNALSLLK